MKFIFVGESLQLINQNKNQIRTWMSIKKLVSETAIYGVSSILGRVLNFALVPLYTGVFLPEEYGIVIQLFAIVAFLMVFFTYRMEVAYFRYGTDKSLDRRTIFNTSFSSIAVSTIILACLATFLAPYFISSYNLVDYKTFVYLCIGIIFIDTLCELPYAELRLKGQPIRFAAIRLTNIFVNLGLNLFFLKFCPWALEGGFFSFMHPFINSVYSPDIGIGYIFIANFIASLVSLLLLSPTFKQYQFLIDKALWKNMMRYVLPLVIVGFAYLINEMLDKLLLENKLAILISLFTQAFRYGAEPFFFRNKNEKNAKELSQKGLLIHFEDPKNVNNYFNVIGKNPDKIQEIITNRIKSIYSNISEERISIEYVCY